MEQITEDVFCSEGTASNWLIVRDGHDLTLIDTGYPSDIDALMASIESVGHRAKDIRAVLITHAHVDHIGALGIFEHAYNTPIYMHPLEIPQAKGLADEQAKLSDVLLRIWRPRVARWAFHVIRAGGAKHVTINSATPFPNSGMLDLPGTPIPIHCGGHTSGHTAYLLPEQGILVAGDALVTGHPLSSTTGPQMLPSFFAHDPKMAYQTLNALAEAPADIVLPGHGPVWRGDLQTAVSHARATAPRKYRAHH